MQGSKIRRIDVDVESAHGLNFNVHWKRMAVTTLSHRLRSVKMEQRKLSDQANTLVDLSKVSGEI